MRHALGVLLALTVVAAAADDAHARKDRDEPAPAPVGVAHVVDGDQAPTHVIAGGLGLAQLLVNETSGAPDGALSVLTLAPGAAVPEHTHETSSETLFVETGRVEMVIDGVSFSAGAGDAIHIPAGALHSAVVVGGAESLRAVQVYVGPGPEQRFAAGPLVTSED